MMRHLALAFLCLLGSAGHVTAAASTPGGSIPEPGALALIATGVCVGVLYARRQRPK